MSTPSAAAVEINEGSLAYGDHVLWERLDLTVARGEFLAILGPNGVGKTSILKVLLGLVRMTSGDVRVLGQSPKRGSSLVGYVPQQRGLDASLPLRGRDLVGFGVDGHRWGLPLPTRMRRSSIESAVLDVDARSFADHPLGQLSGGEQQRLRIGQALASDPDLLLCDEPLLSLDLGHQRAVVELLDRRRLTHGTAIVFVTHEINPILPVVDRVLYIAPDSWAIGTSDQVLTTETLSRLYGTAVDVLRVRGRIVVVGAPDEPDATLGQSGHAHLPNGSGTATS